MYHASNLQNGSGLIRGSAWLVEGSTSSSCVRRKDTGRSQTDGDSFRIEAAAELMTTVPGRVAGAIMNAAELDLEQEGDVRLLVDFQLAHAIHSADTENPVRKSLDNVCAAAQEWPAMPSDYVAPGNKSMTAGSWVACDVLTRSESRTQWKPLNVPESYHSGAVVEHVR